MYINTFFFLIFIKNTSRRRGLYKALFNYFKYNLNFIFETINLRRISNANQQESSMISIVYFYPRNMEYRSLLNLKLTIKGINCFEYVLFTYIQRWSTQLETEAQSLADAYNVSKALNQNVYTSNSGKLIFQGTL